MEKSFVRRIAAVAVPVAVGLAPVLSHAAGVDLMDTGMAGALTDGFDSLKITVTSMISANWALMLGITGIMMLPGLAQKFIRRAAG